MSGVGFLYSGGLWFLFIVEVLPSGLGWTIGLLRLVKVSWLVKLASVFWCVELDFFSLESNGVPSNEF